ncbi:hypothetical protein [Pectobacterium phage Wc4-1]|uniref:Uncharacterized protein n=1 Tax=Pectobacterium phage Wc4 TaxID=2652428 RepID=A0A5P8D4I1_9CAUD|nr:hypothetical protein [Pectobacterium phage Wc4]QFP94049.1 hypothetical protein [Pectobacterium phage Wc4-1]
MKMYGRKSSPFGMAYRDSARKHERQFYKSLKRACKKRERQAGQLQCKEGIEEYDLELQEMWDDLAREYDMDYNLWLDDDYFDDDYDDYEEDNHKSRLECWLDDCDLDY